MILVKAQSLMNRAIASQYLVWKIVKGRSSSLRLPKTYCWMSQKEKPSCHGAAWHVNLNEFEDVKHMAIRGNAVEGVYLSTCNTLF